jgi:hypothetical protein
MGGHGRSLMFGIDFQRALKSRQAEKHDGLLQGNDLLKPTIIVFIKSDHLYAHSYPFGWHKT